MDWRQRVTNLSRGGGLMVAIIALLIATYSVFMVLKERGITNLYSQQQLSCCEFPAIYNFGDSNSDTGAVSAVFGPVFSPYGMTYFHKPFGRYSDGRLIIDFIGKFIHKRFKS
ncbi:putative alpha-L-fucosidase [Helianthus debilis subsp. tardiflorus]